MRITPVAQHLTNNETEYYIGLTKLSCWPYYWSWRCI